MNIRKAAAIYSILTGLSMMAAWVLYYSTGSIAGLKPAGDGIGFHIAAEIATGLLMTIAGAGLMMKKKWAVRIYFLSLGMLIYAALNSSGYYLRSAGNAAVALFAGTFVAAAAFSIIGLRIKE